MLFLERCARNVPEEIFGCVVVPWGVRLSSVMFCRLSAGVVGAKYSCSDLCSVFANSLD